MSLFSFFLNANSKTYQLPLDTLTIDRLGQARSLTYLWKNGGENWMSIFWVKVW